MSKRCILNFVEKDQNFLRLFEHSSSYQSLSFFFFFLTCLIFLAALEDLLIFAVLAVVLIMLSTASTD